MMHLSFAILGLCLIVLIWLCVWLVYATRRNNATAELRHKLVEFAFQKVPDLEKRVAWYRELPSYETMSQTGLFAPLTSKPLSRMINGKYEEEFWRWRAGAMDPGG